MTTWQRATWSLVASLLAVCAAALLWMFWQAFSSLHLQLQTRGANASEQFLVAGTGVLAGLLFKVLAIFVGATLALGGLALSFFNARNVSTFGDEVSKLKLASSSPGIFAVVAGTLIVVVATKHNVESSFHQQGAPYEVTLSPVPGPSPETPRASAPAPAHAQLPPPVARSAASKSLASAPLSACDQAIKAYELVLGNSEANDVCGTRSAARTFVDSANRALQAQSCTGFLRAAPKHVNDALDKVETDTAECKGIRPMRISVNVPIGSTGARFVSQDHSSSGLIR